MRALWATGAMVVVSLVVLGGVVMKRNSVDAKALQANVRNVNAPAATTAPVAPVAPVATTPAAPSAVEASPTTIAATETPAADEGSSKASKKSSKRHHGKAGRGKHGGAHGKVAVASKSDSKPAAAPAKAKGAKQMSNDELDKLLGLK